MALPKLNDMPKYSVVVPSTNQEIRIRPFVVKEEKILLIAMESNDPKQIASAIMDTIVSCSEGISDARKLTSYDVEYLFMQIRSRSVGETSQVRVKCKSCDTNNDVTINIDDIKINQNIPDSKIQLTDNIVLKMKPPSYMQVARNEQIIGESTMMDKIFAIIIESIDSIMTEEERIDFSEYNQQDQIEFLESMTGEQFSKIREYMENQPILKHDVNFTCESCGVMNEYVLEGIQDFF